MVMSLIRPPQTPTFAPSFSPKGSPIINNKQRRNMKRNIILAAIVTLAVGTIAMSPKKADGILGDCRKLLVAGDKLIAGGYFEKADRRVVNNIAQYDGAKWTGLAKGVDGIVRDLCLMGKDVYACGDFSYADKKDNGGVESNQVARWDGTKWNPLEKLNVDQQIHALATDGKNLYAGGRFTKIGGKIDASNIAKWDGKKWSILTKDKFESSVGAGTIIAMAWHDGKLFASGGFETIGDEPCSRMAIFDGKAWSEDGNKGLNANVQMFASNGKTLYACGKFSETGDGTKLNHVAKWNGTKWEPLGNGVEKEAFGIALDGETVYVATPEIIYKWDGKSWTKLPELQYAIFKSVAVFNGTLYAGGDIQGGQFQGICKFVNGKWEPAYQ